MPPYPVPITIFGAGLSGLTLGFCLNRRGIPAIIYERATSSPQYNYGITLHASAYRSLLGLLQMDEVTFRKKLAVDSVQGGTGNLGKCMQNDAFRCHRGRLESLLRNELVISWGKRLKDVQFEEQSKDLTAHFEDGSNLRTETLIGCDGVHSMVRQSLCSSMKINVLPFVVFNGRRRISIDEYKVSMQHFMQDSVLIETHKGDVRLEISVNDFAESHVDLRYTYSRPARTIGDPLHLPDRPIGKAADIPNEFYDELVALRDRESPFKTIFDAGKVREDRVLHWLMRSVEPDLCEAKALASHGMVLVGDAIHATPILGGMGANMAIEDGIELAEHIAINGTGGGWTEFMDLKYHRWMDLVKSSERGIGEMHLPNAPRL